MTISERVRTDDLHNTLYVDGIGFSGELLTELFKGPTPKGYWYRIVDVKDGRIQVETKYDAAVGEI